MSGEQRKVGGGPWRAGAWAGDAAFSGPEPDLSPHIGEGGGKGTGRRCEPLLFPERRAPRKPWFSSRKIGRGGCVWAGGRGRSDVPSVGFGSRSAARDPGAPTRGPRAPGARKAEAARKTAGAVANFRKSGFRRPGAQPRGRARVRAGAGAPESPRTSGITTGRKADVEGGFTL